MTQPFKQPLNMISVHNEQVFALSNDHFSYVFMVTPEGILQHVYYGAALKNPLDIRAHHYRTHRDMTCAHQGTPFFNLSDTPQEYPSFGTSDYRFPAFHARNADGNTITSFIYKSHEIRTHKPKLKGLPSARGGDSQTLVITLTDAQLGLDAELYYTIYADHAVLTRSAKFKNNGAHDINLQHAFSTSLDLPAAEYEILHLHGTWAREFNPERMDMPQGRFVIDSARGTSSAAHNPFIAVMEKGASEDHGRIYAATLIYSGNFAISIEKTEFEDVRVLAGINPFNFNWRLKPDKSFTTPEAVHVFSPNGLRSMSHSFHAFIRDKITPERFSNAARPTYLNTWEAAYFDITETKVMDLARRAKDIGVDMLVLDDGWFDGRKDDTSSLGDWRADAKRFPSDIPHLAAKVRQLGLKFGIWFEPEMVNPKSQLFKDHPDWILHAPGRTPSLGRNQLTLDLSRKEVVDYIFERLDAILSCGDIDYVKWDMNRAMSETGSAGLGGGRQMEVSHRYMLGLYKLLKRLTKKYPDILFENCASGGNRFDLGMLRYMPQGWVSDMSDPVGRLRVITGASYLYPPGAMAAYIGPSPNHQNGRKTALKTRFLAGFFCAARGLSLSEEDLDKNKSELINYMQMAKASAQDMIGGTFDRLIDTDNEVCWQYTAKDARTVYVLYFHILSAPNMPFRRARLSGLDPQGVYVLAEDGANYGGDALMQSGVAMPYVSMTQVKDDMRYMDKGDFSSHLFTFKKKA